MSRRPKGGAGRKKVGKQEPLVSEAWATLCSTTVSMLETVGSINDDAQDDCIEEAAQLNDMCKKRMGFQQRMQLLDAVTQMIEGFLGAFADLTEEQREEHGVAEIFENLYGASFTIISESIEGIDKDGAMPKSVEELEQQIALTLRLIDVIIAVSFENDEASALEYVKPFTTTLFELCCTQLCLKGDKYNFFVRQMALGLMTELIESKNLNPLLLEPTHKNIVDLIINTCFSLCADPSDAAKEEGVVAEAGAKSSKPAKADDDEEEDEDEDDEEGKSLDPNEETSQNLGTQLLDTLTASLVTVEKPDESVAAPLIFAKSQAILADAASSKLDRKSALVCLAVLPEAATTFVKQAGNLATVMGLIQQFMAAGQEALVRSGAFIALSEHLEHLQPEVAQYHEAVLATIITVLKDSIETSNYLVKNKSVIPLQQLVKQELPAKYVAADSADNLFKLLLSQVKTLVEKAERVQDETDLLTNLLSTLGIQANAQGAAVKPFAAEAFELFLSLTEKSTAEDTWAVRAEATEAVAQISKQLEKDALIAAFPRLTASLNSAQAIEPEEHEGTLPDELYELRANVHNAWTELTQLVPAQVESQLDTLFENITRCLDPDYSPNEDMQQEEEDEEDPQMPQGGGEAKMADNEREFALELFQTLCEKLGPKLIPYAMRFLDLTTDGGKNYPSEVQVQLSYALSAMRHLYPLPAGTVITPGVDVELSAEARAMLKQVKDILFDLTQHCTDSDTVEAALDGVATLTVTYGQVLVNDSAETLATVEKFAAKLLKGSAACQTMDPREIPYFNPSDVMGGFGDNGEGEEEDEEEEEEEEEEEAEGEDGAAHEHGPNCNHSHGHGNDEGEGNETLFESLFSVLGAITKAKGPAFKSTIEKLLPKIMKLAKQPKFNGHVSGFFSDLADGFGDELFPMAKDSGMMTQLMEAVNDKENAILSWRNAAFSIGCIFLKCSPALTQDYLEPAQAGLVQVVSILNERLAKNPDLPKSEKDDLLGAKDNAISALGKMLMIGSEHLPRAVLVPLFVANLPITNDFDEAQSVYTAAVKLVNTLPANHPAVIEPEYAALLKVFATVVVKQGSEQKISDQLKGFIVKASRTILAAKPNLRADVVDKIEEEIKTQFIAKIDAAAAE